MSEGLMAMETLARLADQAARCEDCVMSQGQWHCTMNCGGVEKTFASLAATEISEDWLVALGFQWRQTERQPNKHWVIRCNLDGPGQVIETSRIEVQRRGWENQNGEYVGDPNAWMLWIVDMYARQIFVRDIRSCAELIAAIELVCGYPLDPTNHSPGQIWRERPSRVSALISTLDEEVK